MLPLIFVLAIRDCDSESEEMIIEGPTVIYPVKIVSLISFNYHTFHVDIKQLLPSQSHNYHLNCFPGVNIFTVSVPTQAVLCQICIIYQV